VDDGLTDSVLVHIRTQLTTRGKYILCGISETSICGFM